MLVTRYTIQTCCGKASLIFKTNQFITKQHLDKLVSFGFKEHSHFTKAGILYVDNSEFIITGPIGSDRLQVKCKITDCNQKLNDLEMLLQQLG